MIGTHIEDSRTCINHDQVTGLVSDRFVSVGTVEGNVRLWIWYR